MLSARARKREARPRISSGFNCGVGGLLVVSSVAMVNRPFLFVVVRAEGEIAVLPSACLFVYAKSYGKARETCIQEVGPPSRANICRDDSGAVHRRWPCGRRGLD